MMCWYPISDSPLLISQLLPFTGLSQPSPAPIGIEFITLDFLSSV